MWRHWAARKSFGQRLALNQFHAKETSALVLADFENLNDVGMIELCGGNGLGVKTFAVCLGGEVTFEDHLDRDLFAVCDAGRAIHDSHSTSTNFGFERVVSKLTRQLKFLGKLVG